ncbi:MAG: hypothetical protein ACHP85_01775 [Burkholderiales bacterium]|jgi:hypothetical protein
MIHRLITAMLLAGAGAACSSQSNPASASGNPPATVVTSNCTSLTVLSTPPPVGATLLSGQTSTISQGGTYLLPTGSLRLITTGAGRIVLTAITGSTQGNVPITQNFTGPGTLLIEPNPTQTITVSVCTP